MLGIICAEMCWWPHFMTPAPTWVTSSCCKILSLVSEYIDQTLPMMLKAYYHQPLNFLIIIVDRVFGLVIQFEHFAAF